jgi:hypothetical protein
VGESTVSNESVEGKGRQIFKGLCSIVYASLIDSFVDTETEGFLGVLTGNFVSLKFSFSALG